LRRIIGRFNRIAKGMSQMSHRTPVVKRSGREEEDSRDHDQDACPTTQGAAMLLLPLDEDRVFFGSQMLTDLLHVS